MIGFVMFLHAGVALFLVVIILMQSGRGGGLTESFASAESIFGAKTNEFMIKATTAFASLFLITCLGLAVLSSQKNKSLMSNEAAPEAPAPWAETVTGTAEQVAEEVNAQVEAIEVKATEVLPEAAATEAIPEEAPMVTTQ